MQLDQSPMHRKSVSKKNSDQNHKTNIWTKI